MCLYLHKKKNPFKLFPATKLLNKLHQTECYLHANTFSTSSQGHDGCRLCSNWWVLLSLWWMTDGNRDSMLSHFHSICFD